MKILSPRTIAILSLLLIIAGGRMERPARWQHSVSCSSAGPCFPKRLDERSQPSALLDRLLGPVPAPVVAVPAAARSTRAEPTMQPAPLPMEGAKPRVRRIYQGRRASCGRNPSPPLRSLVQTFAKTGTGR